MTRPYSIDLRERVVAAVTSGRSRRQMAKLFKVGVSSVIRWCQRQRTLGTCAAMRTILFGLTAMLDQGPIGTEFHWS